MYRRYHHIILTRTEGGREAGSGELDVKVDSFRVCGHVASFLEQSVQIIRVGFSFCHSRDLSKQAILHY